MRKGLADLLNGLKMGLNTVTGIRKSADTAGDSDDVLITEKYANAQYGGAGGGGFQNFQLWNPRLVGTVSGSSLTYLSRWGRYAISSDGKLAFLSAYINISSHNLSGNIYIEDDGGGLPINTLANRDSGLASFIADDIDFGVALTIRLRGDLNYITLSKTSASYVISGIEDTDVSQSAIIGFSALVECNN